MKKRLLSLMALLLTFVGVANAASVTDLTNLSNEKSYYLDICYGTLYVPVSDETGKYGTSYSASNLTSQYFRYWNWDADSWDTQEDNCKFAILEVDDQLYLYAINAQKFVNPDLTMTAMPPVYTSDNALNFVSTGNSNYPWAIAFGTNYITASSSTPGVKLSTSYAGDYYTIGNIDETGDTFDPTEVLKLFEVQQGTVTFNLSYNGTIVDSETITNAVGTTATFDKSYPLTTITGTTSATITAAAQTIELTASVTGFSTEDSPVYYYIKSGDGMTYLVDHGDGNVLSWYSEKKNFKNYKFAIIGSPFSGTTYLKSKAGNYVYDDGNPDDEYKGAGDGLLYSSATTHRDFTPTSAGTSGVTGGFGLRTTGSYYGEYIYAGNRVSDTFSYSSYWKAGATPSSTTQVLLIEEAETVDITSITWTVSIAGADNVTIGGTTYPNGATFDGAADLTAADVTAPAVEGYTPSVNVDATAGTISVVYLKNATAFAPSIPTGKLMKVGDVAATMTPATAAEDNAHWYLLCQKRDQDDASATTITPVYDYGSGEVLYRAASNVTPESLYGLDPTENTGYLVRFEQVCDGAYRMQFATGNFIQTSLVTGDYTTAGAYKFYNINGTEGHYGWNLTTDYTSYGSIVDNNVAGYSLAFWDTGEVTSTGGNNDWYIYSVEFVDPTTANMTITDAQYATFCAPFDVTIPDGVTAYKVTGVETNGTTLAMEAVTTTIPACTPVVVYSESAVNQNFTGIDTSDGDDECSAGLLTGALNDVTASTGSYVLQNQASGIGFYKVTAEKTVPANRAYLTYSASGAKALNFPTEVTAIKAIESLTSGDAKIYDANGRQIGKLQKGINIVNGVKVLVK